MISAVAHFKLKLFSALSPGHLYEKTMTNIAMVPARPLKWHLFIRKPTIFQLNIEKKKLLGEGKTVYPKSSTRVNTVQDAKLLLDGNKKECSGANTATVPHRKSLKKVPASGYPSGKCFLFIRINPTLPHMFKC